MTKTSRAQMDTVVFRKQGPPEVLEMTKAPVPRVKRGYLLVKVKAVSLNPKDCKIRSGAVPTLLTGLCYPKQTGSDWCGVIVGLHSSQGKACGGFRVGDCVFGHLDGFRDGCSSECRLVRPADCWRTPSGFSFAESAAIGCSYLTALQCLRDYAKLPVLEEYRDVGQREATSACWFGRKPEGGAFSSGAPKDRQPRVLIYGAAGGTGTAATQLAAHLFGAHVTAVSHSRNEAHCRANGASHFIAYDRTDIFASASAPTLLPEEERFDVFFQVHMGPADGSADVTLYPRVGGLMRGGSGCRTRFVALMPEANPLRLLQWAASPVRTGGGGWCQYKLWTSVASSQADLRLLVALAERGQQQGHARKRGQGAEAERPSGAGGPCESAGRGGWLRPRVRVLPGLESIAEGHRMLEAGGKTNGKLAVVLEERA